MKKTLLSVVLLMAVLFPVQLAAQKASVQNIKEFYLQNISAIKENDEVKGYVAFYLVDKKSSKVNNYKLTIWDANLTLKYDIDLVRPSTTKFIEASFNGEYFCVSFYDAKAKKINYILYNDDGKQSGTYSVAASKLEIAAFKTEGAAKVSYLVGLPGVGFALYGQDADKGRHGVVNIINNKGKKIWSITYTGEDKNDFVMAYPIAYDEEILASTVGIRENKMSQNMKKMYVKVHDSKTGKELFTFENRKGEYQYSVSGVRSENEKVYIYGEYFGLKDNPFKDESTGLFLLELDKKGKIQKESYTSWTGDIQKAMPTAMTNEKGRKVRLTMHNIIKTADNKYFIVCEQFYRNADAMGIVSNVINTGNKSAMTKFVLQDLVVLEFDSDFKFVEGKVISKNKSIVSLLPGTDLYGTPFLTLYLKGAGLFDYSFTNQSVDRKTFSSIYVNYDKEESKGASVIGSISYNKNQEIVEDKITLSNKPTLYMVLPAKAGYVTIFEYFRKAKTMDIRMEKLNM